MTYAMFGKSLGKEKNKTHKTALCIIPPQKIWQPIQTIRKKHDKQFYRWMPHINLLYPFKPRSSFSLLIDVLLHVCSQVEPFSVTLSNINYFRHGSKNYTLWLDIDEAEKIVYLQNKILEVVPECNELSKFSSGFTPHLSIGQVKGREKVELLNKRLQSSWKPIHFHLSEINLIWRKDPPNDRFRVGETIPLGKQSQKWS